MIRHLGFLLLAIALGGCVSVSLPSGVGKKSEAVRFDAPAAPFRELAAPSADRAWVNEATGNTISFLSDCNEKIDPALSQLQDEALNVLEKRDLGEQKTLTYNGREAILSSAAGDLDGVPVRMKVLTLKKNACSYTIMYTGVAAQFDKDASAFSKFLDGFRAD